MAKDYYHILGVPRNATKEDIKKAYRKLAHQYHPDKKGGDESRFKEINEAYQILSDDRKRTQYDQFGQVFEGAGGGGSGQGGFEWPGGFRVDFGGDGASSQFDFSDVFEDFLGNMGFSTGRSSRTKERKGKDIRVDMEITFEEAIFGTKKEVELAKLTRCTKSDGTGGEPGTNMKKCPTCQGAGNIRKTQRTILGTLTQVVTCNTCGGVGEQPEVICTRCRGQRVEQRIDRIEIFIPKGTRDGEVLKITGKGEASLSGGVPGDLYVQLYVQPHKYFRRQGDDIIMTIPIKISQAVLGETIDVQTLDGAISLKIPEGTQPGDILKIRGKGAYLPSGYGRGNLLIEIKIDIPRKISRKTRDIIDLLRSEGL